MTDRTEAIRQRWSRATPGPWFVGVHAETMVFAGGDTLSDRSVASCGGYSSNGPDGHAQWQFNYDNAEAIAGAPEDVAFLLAEVERLQGEVKGNRDAFWATESELAPFRALASRVTDKMLMETESAFKHNYNYEIGAILEVLRDLRALAGGGE